MYAHDTHGCAPIIQILYKINIIIINNINIINKKIYIFINNNNII